MMNFLETETSVMEETEIVSFDIIDAIVFEASLELGSLHTSIIEGFHAADSVELAMHKELAKDGCDEKAIREHYEPILEGTFSDIWQRILKYLEQIKKYFSELMDKLANYVNQLMYSQKKWAEKNKERLLKLEKEGKFSNTKVPMFSYHESAMEGKGINNGFTKIVGIIKQFDANASDSLEDIKEIAKSADDEKETTLNKIRAAIVGSSSEVKADEFKKEMLMFFRDTTTPDKKEEQHISIDAILNWFTNETPVKEMRNVSKTVRSAFDSEITKIKSLQSFFKKGDAETHEVEPNDVRSNTDDKEKARALIAVLKKRASMFSFGEKSTMSLVSAWKTAISERNRDYRKFCSKPSK